MAGAVGRAREVARYYKGRDRRAAPMSEDAASKTKRKQEMLALQALGVRLVTLNADQLALIELPEPLAAAVAEAKRVRSREGHRRQLQYIGRLMREVDPAPIRAKLEIWDGQSREATAAHHRAEQTTLLRLLGRQVWSVYGPAADTGGLPGNGARTIYAYPSIPALITGESRGGEKTALPGPGSQPSTERAGQS